MKVNLKNTKTRGNYRIRNSGSRQNTYLFDFYQNFSRNSKVFLFSMLYNNKLALQAQDLLEVSQHKEVKHIDQD